MKIQHLILPGVAFGVAAVLVLPGSSDAFTLNGLTLPTTIRDFRVFNNFSDATANNNIVPDTNFPGYQGAVMAIWKGAIEWGSRLHGNGNGDPQQPGNLGSGGANFDFTFQGLATSVGDLDDNVCSEINAFDDMVLAYTEYFVPPNFNGWRIRFLGTPWTWADGPGTNIPGDQIDIQAVACHELGHALGMGHSADGNATMFPAGGAPNGRSINTDDSNGIKAIYLAASVNKPIITSIMTSPGMVTINGSGFSALNNQVWFTQAGSGGTGTPIMVSNISSNGVTLSANVPGTAGPGDVLVKANFAGNASLSNAWPFTPNTDPLCPSPYSYCFSSPNSFDPNGAYIGFTGTNIVSNNDFVLVTSGVPPNSSGLYFFGLNETFVVFGNGYRCVTTNVFRLPIIQANVFGDAVWNLNLNTTPAAGNIVAGTTWKFQYWYRNVAGGGAGFNLSDGLSVQWCP